MDKVRIGIIGCGGIANAKHMPSLKKISQVEMVAFCDIIRERAEKAARDYGVEGAAVYTDYKELIARDDIDVVHVLTPNKQHSFITVDALEAGKHVMCEKPMAINSAEAKKMLDAAKRTGKKLTIGYQSRFRPDSMYLKKMCEAGELGEVLDYEAHYDRFERGVNPKPWKAAGGAGVGVLYDLGVHIIDQAYVLFGMPNEVYADFRQQRPESPGIDNFEVILYYDKVKAILSAGEVVARQGPHYMVSGRRGTFIKYGEDVQEAALLAGKRPPAPDWDAEGEECWGTLYYDDGAQILEKKIPTVVSSYARYYENLYEVITAGAPALVPPEQTADVLRIIEAAQMSNAKKRRIAL